MSITIISLSSPVKEFPQVISNWNEFSEELQNNILENCTDFRIMNSQEILIYSDRQIVYSCSHTRIYNDEFDEEGQIKITYVFNKNGCQYGDYQAEQ